MTTREEAYVHYAECCESLERARRILLDLRGIGERSAIDNAAFRFAMVEYAKPYRPTEAADPRKRRAYPLGTPDLSREDRALHLRILELRDQALAKPKLTLEDAVAPPARLEAFANSGIAPDSRPIALDLEAIIGLIERTLGAMDLERVRRLASLKKAEARSRIFVKAVKIAVQGAAMLAGVLGLLLICGWLFLLYHSVKEGTPSMASFGSLKFFAFSTFFIFFLLFGAYLIQIAYLMTFRLSPGAVRQICGVAAFFALSHFGFPHVPSHLPTLPTDGRELPWALFAFPARIVAMYFAYRLASNWLCRLLFPAPASGAGTTVTVGLKPATV